MNTDKYWTQEQAIELCVILENIVPAFGCHVALTGGLLYRQGPRKDCDIILYRIRQVKQVLFDDLFVELAKQGIEKTSGFGFCIKAKYNGKRIDFLMPEKEGGYIKEKKEIEPELVDPFATSLT